MPLSLHLPQDILGPGSEVGVESFSSTTASLNLREYASLAFSFPLEKRLLLLRLARISVDLNSSARCSSQCRIHVCDEWFSSLSFINNGSLCGRTQKSCGPGLGIAPLGKHGEEWRGRAGGRPCARSGARIRRRIHSAVARCSCIGFASVFSGCQELVRPPAGTDMQQQHQRQITATS